MALFRHTQKKKPNANWKFGSIQIISLLSNHLIWMHSHNDMLWIKLITLKMIFNFVTRRKETTTEMAISRDFPTDIINTTRATVHCFLGTGFIGCANVKHVSQRKSLFLAIASFSNRLTFVLCSFFQWKFSNFNTSNSIHLFSIQKLCISEVRSKCFCQKHKMLKQMISCANRFLLLLERPPCDIRTKQKQRCTVKSIFAICIPKM